MVVAICGAESTEVRMEAIGAVERREVGFTAVGVSLIERESEEGMGFICVIENVFSRESRVTCDVEIVIRKSLESKVGEREIDVGVICEVGVICDDVDVGDI